MVFSLRLETRGDFCNNIDREGKCRCQVFSIGFLMGKCQVLTIGIHFILSNSCTYVLQSPAIGLSVLHLWSIDSDAPIFISG